MRSSEKIKSIFANLMNKNDLCRYQKIKTERITLAYPSFEDSGVYFITFEIPLRERKIKPDIKYSK